jgi:microcystin-dependent protein
MVMDYLRNGCVKAIRPFVGSSDTIAVRWFKAAPGALEFPEPHAFASSVWEELYGYEPPIGELKPILSWAAKLGPSAPGRQFCGKLEWFQTGIPPEARNGTPCNCVEYPPMPLVIEDDHGNSDTIVTNGFLRLRGGTLTVGSGEGSMSFTVNSVGTDGAIQLSEPGDDAGPLATGNDSFALLPSTDGPRSNLVWRTQAGQSVNLALGADTGSFRTNFLYNYGPGPGILAASVLTRVNPDGSATWSIDPRPATSTGPAVIINGATGTIDLDARAMGTGAGTSSVNLVADNIEVGDGSSTVTIPSAGALGVPTGFLAAFAGVTLPTGWLACDGAAVSRTTFAALFTAIGTTWGAGDGVTTFNVPDLRDRVVVGTSPGGLSNRPTARALADVGGEEDHVQTTAELVTHTHGVTDPGHTHAPVQGAVFLMQSSVIVGAPLYTPGATNSKTNVGLANATTGVSIANTGSSSAANVMQPFAAAVWAIKT